MAAELLIRWLFEIVNSVGKRRCAGVAPCLWASAGVRSMADVAELKPSNDPLADLATRIKAHHAAVRDAARNVVEKAIAAGTLLKEAKDKVGHGKWLTWLEENCELSERTAENY